MSTAARILAGEDWRHAVWELLDGLWDGQALDLEEPARVTPQVDAYLAAVVEHWCARRAIARGIFIGATTIDRV